MEPGKTLMEIYDEVKRDRRKVKHEVYLNVINLYEIAMGEKVEQLTGKHISPAARGRKTDKLLRVLMINFGENKKIGEILEEKNKFKKLMNFGVRFLLKIFTHKNLLIFLNPLLRFQILN